jgi:hypothetical protein
MFDHLINSEGWNCIHNDSKLNSKGKCLKMQVVQKGEIISTMILDSFKSQMFEDASNSEGWNCIPNDFRLF